MLILSSHIEKIYLPILWIYGCQSFLYQRIIWRKYRHINTLPFKNSCPSPSRVTYTGIALPHYVLAVAQSWNSPFQAASAGSHSREMHIAEIPVPSYLIIPGCHTGRHNPLLFTFTGNNVIHCRSVFARNGILPPLSTDG